MKDEKMKDENRTIQYGIVHDAQSSPALTEYAKKGLVDFLREQIVDAEWKIARAKAEIRAYEEAIKAIKGD